MPFTNTGKSGTAALWIPGAATPDFLQIGSGSGTKDVSTTALIDPTAMKAFASTSGTATKVVEFTADYSSVELSGLSLKEFGVITSGASPALWSAEYVNTLVCDGTIEIQFQVTWETF